MKLGTGFSKTHGYRSHDPFGNLSRIQTEQKSDLGTDFSDANVAQAHLIGEALQKASAKKLGALIQDDVLKEICHDGQES